MRGKIIHYNANDGKGLVAAGERQFAFGIVQWHSDSAPAVNQTVELRLAGDSLQSLARVTGETLLKERVSTLAGKLGGMGGAARESLRGGSAGSGLRDAMARLGWPVLGLHVLFVAAALFLPYLKITPPFGGGRSFTLMDLPALSTQLGSPVGGRVLPWLAILALAMPLFWRRRWAWLALLLPLLATLKPGWDLFSAIRKATAPASPFDARMGAVVAGRLLEMLGAGTGLWLCLIAALGMAAHALKRTLLPPADGLPGPRHAG